MSIRELKERLSKFPDHFEIEALLAGIEKDDKTAEFVDVSFDYNGKTVYLELATPRLR